MIVDLAGCLSSRSWISEEAFDTIISATAKVMRDRGRNPRDIKPEHFPLHLRSRALAQLNETIAIAYQNQFQQVLDLDRDRFVSDAAAALRYFDEVDRLIPYGFKYETAGPELRDQLRGVVAAPISLDEGESYAGRHHWEAVFFPEVLGLFWALFDEEPTATFNPDTGISPSAAIVFLFEIVYAVRESRSAEALFSASRIAHFNLPDWELNSYDAVRNKIAFWKKKTSAAGTKELWREAADFFRRQLVTPPE
jgi:hypothetical protein